jgi:hypothetical protein
VYAKVTRKERDRFVCLGAGSRTVSRLTNA